MERRAMATSVLVSFLTFPALLASPALPAPPALPAALQEPFRTSSSELVVLPVVVTDRPDHYVADLSQDRFSVFDNGRAVPIEFFSAEDTPVTIGLVIDASSSMRHKIGDVVAAAAAFAQASNPDDELFALYFNDGVHDAVPDRMFLPAGDLTGLTRALRLLVAEGRTSLYDALLEGLDRLGQGTRPRKALVLVS